MEINRIYKLTNGIEIYLDRINAIGAIDKDLHGNIFIPVYFERATKPVKFQVGFCKGENTPEIKKRVLSESYYLNEAWRNFINQKL